VSVSGKLCLFGTVECREFMQMMIEEIDDVEFEGSVGVDDPLTIGLLEGLDDLEAEMFDPVALLSPEAREIFEEARLEARRLTTIRYVV
jgi:hypothetical protein